MRVAIAALVSFTATGCFLAPLEIPLGTLSPDSGSATGGGSGGGSATGGGSPAGGGGAGGGTPIVSDDGGMLIPLLPMVSEASCRWSLPAANCGGESCLALYAHNQTPQLLLHPTGQALPYRLHHMITVTDAHAYVVTYDSAQPLTGPRRLLAVSSTSGGQPIVLDEYSGLNLSISLAAVRGTQVYFIFSEQQVSGGPVTRSLKKANLATPGPAVAELVATGVPALWYLAPEDIDVDLGGGRAYFLGDGTGLWSVGLSAPTSFQPITGPANPQLIKAWARSGNTLYFSECGSSCEVFQMPVTGGSVQRLAFGSAEQMGSIQKLVTDGTRLWAINAQVLAELKLDGSAQGVRYRSGPFPQHSGHLLASSLVADSGKLYVGQICYPDADAPEYGTVELDVGAASARWLNDLPEYPFVPHVVPIQGFENGIRQNTHGLVKIGVQ